MRISGNAPAANRNRPMVSEVPLWWAVVGWSTPRLGTLSRGLRFRRRFAGGRRAARGVGRMVLMD
jgi:hypothetical protein